MKLSQCGKWRQIGSPSREVAQMRTGIRCCPGLPDIDPSIALAQVARCHIEDRLPPADLLATQQSGNGGLIGMAARLFAKARPWEPKLESETA
jgi:hypothetical protein